ncbi:MAG: hypothetical protein KJ052_05675 [Candidatus Hydrogenedentes bacterium]|nr:hypothetical protein [Candidatus Hydrogenedentota bacterium]
MNAENGIVVTLSGPNTDAAGHALAMRLIELGRKTELAGRSLEKTMGNQTAVATLVRMLTRNGVSVVYTLDEPLETGGIPTLSAQVGEFDTPDFAAEKVLDLLAAKGWVALDTGGYTPEEEERIRRRLADLGYVE